MAKSKIRQEIEKILELNDPIIFTDPTNYKRTKYRMKFVTWQPATEEQVQQIEALPHVLKVSYTRHCAGSYYPGITVYLDILPSKVTF